MSQFESEVSKEIIFVASIDFDGCSDNDESREAIIEHIAQSCRHLKDLKKIILMIGSLRQSLSLDILNARHNSQYPNYISCTSIIEHLETRLKNIFPSIEIITDTYLLFDSFQQLEHGTTFKCMQKIFAEIDHQYIRDFHSDSDSPLTSACQHEASGINLLTAEHFTDCSKISIVYSQLHHISAQYQDKRIIMHFYDDKIKILENLYCFYKRNLQWIPEILTLNFFRQMAISEYKPVQAFHHLSGRGPINTEYHHHLVELAKSFNWQSIPEDFRCFENNFKQIFPTPEMPEEFISIPEESQPLPYESIKIPLSFDTPMEKEQFQQKARQEADAIFNELISIEKSFFAEFKASLCDYKVYENYYRTWYEIFKLKQSKYTPKTEMKINELESILHCNLSPQEYEDLSTEAENYAQAHFTFDQRIANCTAYYHQSLQDLNHRISKTPIKQTGFIVPKPKRAPTHFNLSLFNSFAEPYGDDSNRNILS